MTPFKALLIAILLTCTAPLIPNAQDVTDANLQRAADRIAVVEGIDMLMQTCSADTKGSRTPWLRWLFNVKGLWGHNTCSKSFD